MPEIKCPKCGEAFAVDEAGYAQILKQVHDKEFEIEIEKRLSEMSKQKDSELKNAILEKENSYNSDIADKDKKIEGLNAEIEAIKLNEKLNITTAVQEKENQSQRIIAERDRVIADLQNQLNSKETEKELAVSNAIRTKEKEIFEKNEEITKLRNNIELKEKENQLNENALLEKHKGELALRDEEIERLKDFKVRLSTKMVGESLEQHCMNAFDSIRMAAFPKASFGKDNEVVENSKGDFIFREAEDGTEFISIMFEMKNEMDTTATKHKNEDFFKELDKDRNNKNCEYAVLVSLLETDNELYNNGIVDVSYKYPKMYVIRPQFFIPLITLLRNAALNSLQVRKELAVVRNQQIDIVHFEENMQVFKDGFARNYELASRKFQDAIDDINKTIKALEKTRDDLMSSDRNLRLANDKAQDLSIKKLTKNAPSVRKMFEQAEDVN